MANAIHFRHLHAKWLEIKAARERAQMEVDEAYLASLGGKGVPPTRKQKEHIADLLRQEFEVRGELDDLIFERAH